MTIRIHKRSINPHLARKIREISGENVNVCIQCGTCGGVCPMYEHVPAPPRVLVQLAQLGHEEAIEKLRTYDYCASCHHCETRCPRGLDMPRVMEALRQLKLRKNEDMLRIEDIPAEDIDEMPQIALVAAFRKLTA